MRPLSLFTFALAAALGRGQMMGAMEAAGDLVRDHREAIDAARLGGERGEIGGAEARRGTLPDPDTDPGRQELQIVRAGRQALRGDQLRLTEGVHVIYRGYDLFADEVDGDLTIEVFELRGNVRVYGAETRIEGDSIEIRFRDRTYTAIRAESVLRPSLLGGRTLRDIFFSADQVSGGDTEVRGERAILTTCEHLAPHYELRAGSGRLLPNDRIILRNVEAWALGIRLFRVPYVDVPLDRRTSFTPEVGQSRDEGFFVKTRWDVATPIDQRFAYRIDAYTKLGLGLGGDYTYDRPGMSGQARVYGISGTNSFLLANDHRQQWGRSTFLVSNLYERNNYLTAPGSTVERTQASLQIPQATATTRFSLSRNANRGAGGFSFQQRSLGMSDQRRWSTVTRTSLDVTWNSSSSGSGGTANRQQVDLRFRGEHDVKQAVAELEYVRSIPIGESPGFFSASDRTPVLAIKSEARRLLSPAWAERLPFRAELSLGEFGEGRTQSRLSRSMFDFRMDRTDRSTSRWRFDYSTRFRQTMYSDDTAQFTVQLNPRLSYRLGRDTSLNLRYSYLRSQGFTPLQIDRTGRTDFFTADLSARPVPQVLIGAQTGYDLRLAQQGQSPWQTVGARLEVQPADWLLFRSLASYDPARHVWSNIRLDVSWQAGATFVSLNARYDGLRHTWGNLNLYVDGFRWGRLNTSAILAYNGFLNKIESSQYQFTYDLHCWEAILQVRDNQTGFRSGTEFTVFLRLKALPFDPNFGIGQRGQAIGGSGMGF